MDLKLLKEDRRHGTPPFPFATYAMDRQADGTVLDNHWHEESEFLWVVSGQAVFQIGLATFELHEGEAMFVPGGEVHGGFSETNGPCSYRAAVFHLDWLAEGGDDIAARFIRPLSKGEASIPMYYDRSTGWGRRVLARLNRMYRTFESGTETRELRIKAGLYALFADLIDAGQWRRAVPGSTVNSQTVERLKAAVTYMEAHFSQPLSVPALAEMAGMSAGHFSRMFKIVMRKTPMDYLNHYRIRHAAYLLQNTDWSVAEVALETGLPHFSYFSKKFSAVYGRTPSQFRKKFRSL
ncbi:helix-turn-helix domain-containing protein [Cohnella hongkongensis]|uniref:Helix-turn-helix domain-containing protein n=1 Tax=Cohnella hongkongensis TaxID=178337 RepID=A0ABV9FD54_9BACL